MAAKFTWLAHRPELRVAFHGGAITGMRVVGLGLLIVPLLPLAG